MKREISRKIRAIADDIGTAAALAEAEQITASLEAEYDSEVKAGRSELDAYRYVLSNIDEIEDMLRSLPSDENERERKKRKDNKKRALHLLNAASSIVWLLSVLGFFIFGSRYVGFDDAWLIFLYAAIVQAIIGMVKKYNKGKTLKRTLRGGLSSILWLGCVIGFFLISHFMSHAWLVFIVGAIVQVIINTATKE